MTTTSLEIKYERLTRLIELAEILSQQTNFEEILRLVTQQAASLLNAESTLLMMINPRTQQTIKTVFKAGQESHKRRFHFLHLQVFGWVMKHNQSFLTQNMQKDSRFRKSHLKDIPFKSVMCVPLYSEGVIIGSLMLLNRVHEEEPFNDNDLAYLEKLATVAAPFLRNVQKIQEYFLTPMPEVVLLTRYEALGLLGKSKKFVELLHAIETAARCDVRVLLEGQSGTGKELVARAIHQLSSRKEHPLVTIDCGAIPENLIESELFGHVKGAFTGATYERKGLFVEANHGTLFMDEVSNLPYDMQAKLLRVLQEGEIRPVGSNLLRKVDVRIIAASGLPLRQLVEQEKFREDLYYRLNVYPIHVPPLKERREDIPLLANYFLKKFVRQQQKQAESFHESLLRYMQQRNWSGNIRELENFVERLVTLATPQAKVLDLNILPPEFRKEFTKIIDAPESQPIRKPLQENIEELEEKLIRQALTENDWNQSEAARALQISEGTMRYKMGKFKIVKPPELLASVRG